MTSPKRVNITHLHREINKIVGEVEMGRVEKCHPDMPAESAYYAAIDLLEACPELKNNPLSVLYYLDTDVPNEWVEYWDDKPDADSALRAMARRALEQEIYRELERRIS